jgi:hypothetical protein
MKTASWSVDIPNTSSCCKHTLKNVLFEEHTIGLNYLVPGCSVVECEVPVAIN